ncbi:hypothetical protein NDU88_002545 [Pleurodeles waltl]|uniref:Uncharacterized protein n=1 Tax=Pleurodeles waltl TaxID=8319 RepID=A0AAV7PBY5_PLEWA|nr:hypothetical protein NDU88_002545 [Pleurodeles waltl]
MERTFFLTSFMSSVRLSTFLINLSNFRDNAWKAAGSIGGSVLVCMPVEVDVVAGVVWPRDSPAPTTRLGPGLEEDAWSVAGSTWVDLVDVVSVVVGGPVGGACGVAHHAPEARSECYLQAILRYPHCTCRMCLYLIARRSKWLRSAALRFAAVKRKGKYLALDFQWVEYHNGSFVHY